MPHAVTRLIEQRSGHSAEICVTRNYFYLQILKAIGENLEMLDLSGSVMSPITDEGLKAVSKYCPNLQNLGEIL